MEMVTENLTVAPAGVESTGDQSVASKASQLAGVLSTQCLNSLEGLERTIAFLGTDLVLPEASDPNLGLFALRACLIDHPDRVTAVRDEARRLRYEVLEATYDSLLERVERETEAATSHPALSGLFHRLDNLANEARVHWQEGRREKAVDALRYALVVVQRAYQPLASRTFEGTGSRSEASRKGVPNPSRKPLKQKGGNQGNGKGKNR